MQKLIIEVRVNEYTMRHENPHVPWSAKELGMTAQEIQSAGASIVQFHMRKSDGAPAHGFDAYEEAVASIRAHSGLLINPTLGQITVGGSRDRIQHLEHFKDRPELLPEICGIDPGSTNIDTYDAASKSFKTLDKVYVNAHETLQLFAQRFKALGIKPALACWSIPFLRTSAALIEMGLIEPPPYFTFICTEGGVMGGHPATPQGLRAYLDHLPSKVPPVWSVCCKSGNLLPLAMTAIEQGGHVAIGIGDYAYPELGYPTNAALVDEVVKLARLVGREIASPQEAREMLGIANPSS
jgi:uncharacterized protein (DUF849 family)